MIKRLVYMVEAFDLIEFFAVASLFGWLSFSGLNESKISKVDNKNKEARSNLRRISDYFIVSFIFYAISGCCDYFFHHATLLGVIVPNFGFGVATITFFMAGGIALALPMIEIWRVGWDELGDIVVPPVDYILGVSLLTIAGATFVFSFYTSNPIVRAASVSSVIPVPTIEFTWAGYQLPNAVVGAASTRRFDAFFVYHDHPSQLQFQTFSTSTEFVPIIRGKGDFRLTYSVVSDNFPVARQSFLVHVSDRLEDLRFEATDDLN